MSRDNSRDVSSLEVTLRGSQVDIDPIANGTKPFDDVKVMLIKGIDGTGAECLATEFSSSTSYSKGDICTYNGSLYRANTSHQGVWNASDFDQVTVDSAFMAKGRDYVTAGQKSGTTLGTKATAEGEDSTASGNYAHAEGKGSTASGQFSHAEGRSTIAFNTASHAEGYTSEATGYASHAEGRACKASSHFSHAEGQNTKTGTAEGQHVQGKFNVGKDTTAFEIGNGTESNARSNAFEVDWSGNVVASGNITDGDGNVLAEKVAKSGDIMTGNLNVFGSNDLIYDETVGADEALEVTNGSTVTITVDGTLVFLDSGSYESLYLVDGNKVNVIPYGQSMEFVSSSAWTAKVYQISSSANLNVSGSIVDGLGNKLSLKADYADISETKTVSGNPITLTDALPLPLESCVVNVSPIQDLHGYDKPWVGGAGKNLLPYTVEGLKSANTGTWSGNTYTLAGMTYTIMTDDGDNVIGIDVDGTTSTYPNFNSPTFNLPVGSYKLVPTMRVRLYKGNTLILDTGSVSTFTVDSASDNYFVALFTGAGTASHKIAKPMIISASETDTTFAPYTNNCPIRGMDEIGLTVEGKNQCPVEKFAYSANSFSLGSGSYNFSFRRLGSPKYSTSKIKLQDSNDNNIVSIPFSGVPVGGYFSVTFTLTETTSCHIANENVNVDSSGYAIDNIQIERGNERTDFEPYITPITKTKSLEDTYYGISLNWLTGEMTVKRTIDVLNGNNSDSYYSFIEAGRVNFDKTTLLYKKNATIEEMSSRYKRLPQSADNSSFKNLTGYANGVFDFSNTSTGNKTIRIRDDRFTDLPTALSILATEQPVFCSEIATPRTEQLTPELLTLLRGYNYISSTAYELILTYLANRVDEVDNKADQAEIATVENGNTASKAYSTNEFMMWKGGLYKVTQAIASGATITSGTNVTKTTIGAVLTALLNG